MVPRKRIPRVIQKKRQRTVRSFVLYVLLLLSMVGGGWYIVHQNSMRMQSITIDTPDQSKLKLFTKVKQDFYDEHQLFYQLFLPKDSIISPSLHELANHLYDTFPYIKEIEIDRTDWFHARLLIREYTRQDTLKQEDRYFKISPEGYVFDYAQDVRGRVFLHSEELVLRNSVLDQEQFMLLTKFLDDLDTLGVGVAQISITNELETILELSRGAKIIIRTNGRYDSYRETLREILRYKEFSYDFKQGYFRQPVAYINLRYGDRVLYCYRTDVCADNYSLINHDE